MADLVDGQAEVGGDLLIQPERIPAVEDDLLDDGPLSVRQILAHVGNVLTDTRRKKGARWGYTCVVWKPFRVSSWGILFVGLKTEPRHKSGPRDDGISAFPPVGGEAVAGKCPSFSARPSFVYPTPATSS